MKKIFVCLVYFFGLIQLSNGQDNNITRAVLVDKIRSEDPYCDSIRNFITTSIKRMDKEGLFTVYDWNSETNIFTINKAYTNSEKPSSSIIFLKPDAYFNRKPAFNYTVDTSGKTTSVYFTSGFSASMLVKVVDLATSKIVHYEEISILPKNEDKIFVDNFSKEFGGDPNTIKKTNIKAYNATVEKLTKTYTQKIFAIYEQNLTAAKYTLKNINRNLVGIEGRVFEVKPQPNITEKSIKEMTIFAGAENGLMQGALYKCYTKRNIGDKFYYEELATVSVKSVGEKESIVKTLLFGSKDLATALKNKEKIILIPDENKYLLNRINFPGKEEPISVTLKKECLFCSKDMENQILSSPLFNLVERNAPELNYFAKLLKKEDFIDYSVEDLQGKKIGYQILISNEAKFLNATDVSTNRNLVSIDKNGSFLGMSYDRGVTPDMLFAIANAYKQDEYSIQLIEVKEQKKDKIEEVYVYNPAGFEVYSKFDIITLVKEEIDGETLFRANKIGEGRLGKMYSVNVAVMKIKEGEKELFKLLSEKQKVYFTYPIKK